MTGSCSHEIRFRGGYTLSWKYIFLCVLDRHELFSCRVSKPDDTPFSWRWFTPTKTIRDGSLPRKLYFRGVRFVRVISWRAPVTKHFRGGIHSFRDGFSLTKFLFSDSDSYFAVALVYYTASPQPPSDFWLPSGFDFYASPKPTETHTNYCQLLASTCHFLSVSVSFRQDEFVLDFDTTRFLEKRELSGRIRRARTLAAPRLGFSLNSTRHWKTKTELLSASKIHAHVVLWLLSVAYHFRVQTSEWKVRRFYFSVFFTVSFILLFVWCLNN